MPPIYRKLLVEYDDAIVSSLTVGVLRYPSEGGTLGQALVLGPDNRITFENISRDLTLAVTGTGATNYLPKFTAPRILGLSQVYDNGTNVGFNTDQPTNTVDINGTLRVRQITNATGSFVTLSTTGVLQQRTPAQVLLDLGAQPTGSYVTTDRTLTINGVTYDLSENRSWVIAGGGGGTPTIYTGSFPIQITTNADISGNLYVTASHADSGVTPGIYNSVTVDAKGHITSGSVKPTGHTIQNSGSNLPQQDSLSFVRMIVENDAVNGTTVVKRPPSTILSGSAPTTDVLEGDIWINDETWKKYIRYDGYWVENGKVCGGTTSTAGESSLKFLHQRSGPHLNEGNSYQVGTDNIVVGSNIFTPSEMLEGMKYEIECSIYDDTNHGGGTEIKYYALTFASDSANIDSRRLVFSNANYQSNTFVVTFKALVSFSGISASNRTVEIRLLSYSGISANSTIFRMQPVLGTYLVSYNMDTTVNQTLNMYFKWIWSEGLYNVFPNSAVVVSNVVCKKLE